MKFQPRHPAIRLNIILGCIFITLKLCKVIDWSWLWVTCPFWIPFAVFAVILIAFAFLLMGAAALDIHNHFKKQNKK